MNLTTNPDILMNSTKQVKHTSDFSIGYSMEETADSFNMILSNKRITEVLIRLHRSAGWSAPLLIVKPEDRFYRVKAMVQCAFKWVTG